MVTWYYMQKTTGYAHLRLRCRSLSPLEGDSDGAKRTQDEIKALRTQKSIETCRQFATLMQVKALHEHISDHMRREEGAAQERAKRRGREAQRSNWSTGSAHVLQQRQQAVSALRDVTSYEMVQEALRAETEFHIQMFGRIREDYRTEAVCCGTWIPAWAAAFRETVHMAANVTSPVRYAQTMPPGSSMPGHPHMLPRLFCPSLPIPPTKLFRPAAR